MIESKCPDILPDWLRFVKGVVDSEDLPLSISRERMQDSALLRKMNDVLTRKIIRHLQSEHKKDPEKYRKEFFPECGIFLKEGVCQVKTSGRKGHRQRKCTPAHTRNRTANKQK